MNAKKKTLSIALAASLAAVAVVGSSLAYFTDKDEKHNTLTIGNVDITLTEPKWDAEEVEDLYPGEAVAKDPTVENTGKNPAFVRIKVEWPENVALSYRTDYVDGKLGENWVKHGDYYYYSKVLGTEEGSNTTDALFDQVVLSTDVTNGFDGIYDIVVKAEAVQAQGARTKWAEVQTMTVEEIAAWFATCIG